MVRNAQLHFCGKDFSVGKTFRDNDEKVMKYLFEMLNVFVFTG